METMLNAEDSLDELNAILFTPRPKIFFREAGEIEKLDTTLQLPPLIITTEPTSNAVGFRSGQRSGLVYANGVALKIKGCRIEEAFQNEGPYQTTHEGTLYAPEGGVTLENAKKEVSSMIRINETLHREGFPTPFEPVGIIRYVKTFKSSHMDEEKELGAVVPSIKGDTRLPELYWNAKDNDALAEVTYYLGIMAGAQKRVTENARVVWSYDTGDAHIGNYIVFAENGSVWLSMSDFGSMVTARDFVRFNRREFSEMWKRERIRIMWSTMDDTYHQVDGIKREDDGFGFIDLGIAGQHNFVKGFCDGYENPDKMQKIPLDYFHLAFG